MGIQEGMEESAGDWRVLLAINFVLSLTFGYLIVFGLSYIEVLAFEWTTVAAAALLLMALTYAITH